MTVVFMPIANHPEVVASSLGITTEVITGDRPNQCMPKNMRKTHDMLFSDMVMSRLEMDLLAMLLATAIEDPQAQEVCEQTRAEMAKESSTKSFDLRYQFDTTTISNWLQIKKDDVRGTMRKVARTIMSRPIGLHQHGVSQDNDFSYISPFRKIEWKRGILSITIAGEALTLMLDLTRGYANINLPTFVSLNSAYGKRLY